MTEKIAVVGMSVRAPGIDSLDKYWSVIEKGEIMLTRLSGRQQVDYGVNANKQRDENYVPVSGYTEKYHYFDPSPFGISEADAKCMSPAHRQLLECAHEALENAAINIEDNNKISVFVGCENDYGDVVSTIDEEDLMSFSNGTRVDFASSQISFNLNLRGESHTVMSACATSLVAIHEAVKSLRAKKSNIAVAGGATILTRSQTGYIAGQNGMFSPTGEINPFDERSDGTIFTNGAGAVVLMPLQQAIENKHSVIATIIGSGASNDGKPKDKNTFISPSVNGQSEAIEMALLDANIKPHSVGYIECHGTGTKLGDPIEIQSLNKYYGKNISSQKSCEFKCYVGSVKANIGHTRAAAGVLSFIKACLTLNNNIIPPVAGFKKLNPKIVEMNTSFEFSGKPSTFKSEFGKRRAAVSSFGFGGSNSHVIIEKEEFITKQSYKENDSLNKSLPYLRLSSETPNALRRLRDEYVKFILSNEKINLDSLARTTNFGRKSYKYRGVYEVTSKSDYPIQMKEIFEPYFNNEDKNVVFLFPGQGSQFSGMSERLYETSGLYRDIIHENMRYINEALGDNLISKIFDKSEKVREQLNLTLYSQPAIFLIEISLAEFLIKSGLSPDYLVGHSVGELSAAYISGVLSLESASKIITKRAQLMMNCKPGGMLAILLDEEHTRKLIPNSLDIAAINSRHVTVISGSQDDLNKFKQTLKEKSVIYKKLKSSHAFHSYMMEPIQKDFEHYLEKFTFSAPKIPIISTVTEDYVSDVDILSPKYWASQVRNTVRFEGAITNHLIKLNPIFIEVGPGDSLKTSLSYIDKSAICISTIEQDKSTLQSNDFIQKNVIEKSWVFGADIRQTSYNNYGNAQLIAIPTTQYQKKKYWMDNMPVPFEFGEDLSFISYDYSKYDIKTVPSITQSPQIWLTNCVNPAKLNHAISDQSSTCPLHIIDISTDYHQLIEQITSQKNNGKIHDAPLIETYWSRLFNDVLEKVTGIVNYEIVLLLDIRNDKVSKEIKPDYFEYTLTLSIIKAAFKHQICDLLKLTLLTHNTVSLKSCSHSLSPEKSAVLGPIRSSKCEIPELSIKMLNIDEQFSFDEDKNKNLTYLVLKLATSSTDQSVFLIHNGDLYSESPFNINSLSFGQSHIRDNAVVFITGGTGALGLLCAENLYDCKNVKLALTTRLDVPNKDKWEQVIQSDSKLGLILSAIKKLELKGAEVLILKADSEDYDQLLQAVDTTEKHLGPINVIIHAAGGSNPTLLIEEDNQFPDKLRGKPDGAIYLDDIFSHKQIDAFIMFSSIASKTPERGQCVYVAGNSVLDSIAAKRSSLGLGFTKAIGWGPWQEIGMASKKTKSARQLFRYSEDNSQVLSHPLLKHEINLMSNRKIYLGVLSPKNNWVVDAHRFDYDKIVFAGAAQLSCMYDAAKLFFNGEQNIQIDSVEYIKPIKIVETGSVFKIIISNEDNINNVLELYYSNSTNNPLDCDIEWILATQALVSKHTIPIRKSYHDNDQFMSSEFSDVDIPFVWGYWCKNKSHQPYCNYNLSTLGVSSTKYISKLSTDDRFSCDYSINPIVIDYMQQIIEEKVYPSSSNDIINYPARINSVVFWGEFRNNVTVHSEYHPIGNSFDFDVHGNEGILSMKIIGFECRPGKLDKLESTAITNAGNNFGLVLDHIADLNSLNIVDLEREPLDRDLVEIQVTNAGVNFKDLLIYLGQIPFDSTQLESVPLGGEISGYITKLGQDVVGLEVGDAVMGFSNGGGFSKYCVTHQDLVIRIPSCLSMEQASGSPVVFSTALYSLVNLAGIQDGQSVLVHSGAGGLGQAAIQICKLYNADIFATAGNSEKRELLASQGIKNIYNSRDGIFSEQILNDTNGEGIDIILNSLNGDLMLKSLELIADNGHFIELGKRDLIEKTPIPMSLFDRGINYHSFDLGNLISRDRKVALRLLDQLSNLFNRRKITALRTQIYTYNDAFNLFNDLSQSNHIGKKCLSFGDYQTQWDSIADDFYTKYGHGVSIDSGLSAFQKVLSTDNSSPYILIAESIDQYSSDTYTSSDDNILMDGSSSRKKRRLNVPLVLPQNPTQISLISIWKDVLEIDEIGIDDDFFDLGGNSMLAIRILFKMLRLYNKRFPSDILLDSSTVRQLSSYVDNSISPKS